MLADGFYDLQLRIGELEALQEKTGVGPLKTLNRLLTDELTVADITETIRLGLIGSGEMTPREATSYVENSLIKPVDPSNRAFLMDYRIPAANALNAALNGVSEEVIDQDAGEPNPEAISPSLSAESDGATITNAPE